MKKLILISLFLFGFSFSASLDSILSSGAKLKVLGMWAHPDDEFFMSTIATKKYRNVELTAITFKDGKDEPCLYGIKNTDTIYSRGCPCTWGTISCPDTMGKFRLMRMAKAKAALGMKNRFYPLDSLASATDTNVVIDSLVKWIKYYNPNIILTHNLAGDYVSSLTGEGKRDHAFVSSMVVSAVRKLTLKPLVYMVVYNFRRSNGQLLTPQAVGSPLPTDSIPADTTWSYIQKAGQYYDGSGFYMDVYKVGPAYQKNWFHKYEE